MLQVVKSQMSRYIIQELMNAEFDYVDAIKFARCFWDNFGVNIRVTDPNPPDVEVYMNAAMVYVLVLKDKGIKGKAVSAVKEFLKFVRKP